MKNKETVVLDTFDGHLVLLCKGHYLKNEDFFDALRNFWGVRCGCDFGDEGDRFLENVADTMFKIMRKCNPERMEYFHEVLHRELTYKPFLGLHTKPQNMSHIRAVVWEYRSFLLQLKISEIVDEKRHKLISLPKPQRRIFRRVIQGKGEYSDYKLITDKDTRKK